MFRLFDLFALAIERLWQHRVLVFWALVGLATATTLALSLPLYVDAVNTNLLASRLDDPPYAFRFRYIGSWNGNITAEDVTTASATIHDRFASGVGLPVQRRVSFVRGTAQPFMVEDNRPLGTYSLGTLSGAEDQITISAGEWPPPTPAKEGDPLPVLIPETMLYTIGLQVGDKLTITRPGEDPLQLRVAALWSAVNANDPAWIFPTKFFDEIFLVQPDDLWTITKNNPLPVEEAAWYLLFDGQSIRTAEVESLLSRVSDGERDVRGALPGVQMGGPAWGGQIAVAGGGFPGVVVNPAIGAILNPNNRLPAPDPVQVTVTGDCQVRVTWKDNATNETEYRVRRIPPGGGAETIAAVLKPNTQEYVDLAPEPGKYQYSVWVGVTQGNQVTDHNASQFTSVDIPASPVCQPLPKWMRVFFQPVEFKPHNAAFSEGFVNAGIGLKKGLPILRLPQGQGESVPVAQFGSQAYQLEFWLPAAMGPGDALDFTLVGSARQPNNPPLPQGQFTALHKYEELTGPNRKQVYQSPQQGQAFDFSYKLYLEPWQWGAPQAQPSSLLPKPTNLKLAVAQNGDHKLTWNYDKAARDKYVSGFNVYRDYFCPGFDYKMGMPVVLGREAASVNLAAAAMPTGCACSYQVSAFGQGGESELSDAQTPSDCYTFTPDSSVTVTFKSLEISNQTLPQARNTYLYLWANYYPLETFNKAHFFAGTHDLGKIELNGRQGNPTVTVSMKKGQSLQLGFYLANTCKSVDVTIPAANLGAAQDVVVQSADGGCKLTAQVKGSSVGQPPNQPAPNQPPQQPKYGPGCGDTGCTIEFVNNTSYNIVGLNIIRLGNNVTENPIGQPNQAICPGCSLPVYQFYDEQYQYQAYYGAWAQGQAQPTITGNGPLSPVFAGTAQKISIQDPKAQSQDTQTLRGLLGNSILPWDLGASSGDPNICLGHCSIRLEFAANGTFKYSEKPDPLSQYVPVATGQYHMIVHDSVHKIFRVRLVSNHPAAVSFPKDAYFSYATACFLVTVNSQRFGNTLVYGSGNCPLHVPLENLLPPCDPNDPSPQCRP
jgi:hypothetical protein